MRISKKYGFYLPSRDADDVVDINQISANFEIIDEEMSSVSLEENSEVVFVGGGAEGSSTVDLVIDGELSQVSENAVQNKAVTKAIKELRIDYVIEQGVAEDWTYRKWASGKLECWAKFEGEVAVNNLWGGQSVLRYGLIGSFNYPFEFIEKPVVSVDLDAQDSWGNKYPSTTTETGNIYAVGAVEKTEQYTLNIFATGRFE